MVILDIFARCLPVPFLWVFLLKCFAFLDFLRVFCYDDFRNDFGSQGGNMEQVSIDRLMNCIRKTSGISYELAVYTDGTVSVFDYSGQEVDFFSDIEDASRAYLIF